MIFFPVLVVIAIGVVMLLVTHRDLRPVARWGMGVALIAIGITHFTAPTPFEDHIPSWVPGDAFLVALTGAMEIGLGFAFFVPWSRLPELGQLTALFFVAVYPANIYVAVSGAEVSGNSGGPAPWIRLPFQFLFIAWALWCTDEPAETRTELPTHGLIPRLPWAKGPARSVQPEPEATVVMASILQLQRYRDVPAFLLAALRLRALFRRTPGAIRLSLSTIPLRRTFWTLSQWQSQDDLDRYTRHADHVKVMKTFASRMTGFTLATWNQADSTPPEWRHAETTVAAARNSTSASPSKGDQPDEPD